MHLAKRRARDWAPHFLLAQAVYDYTIMYRPHARDQARPSERSLLFGTMPREVHVHVTRKTVLKPAFPTARDPSPTLADTLAQRRRIERARTSFAGHARDALPNMSDESAVKVRRARVA